MSGPVALVTGASRGIGRMLANGLSERGLQVVGIARTPVDEWEELPQSIVRRQCDVADESAVRRLYSSIRKEFGQLDVLINNVGVFSGELLQTASAERVAAVLSGNLGTAHVMTREAAKMMRARGAGRVISISSIAAMIPLAGNALYGASKLAVEGLMHSYAVEFKGSGITFNSIAVSFVEGTGMVDALKPQVRAQYEERLLVPRALLIDEVVGTVVFLASDAAASITGQTIALGSPT